MKKTFLILLAAAAAVLGLLCLIPRGEDTNLVTFYYARNDYLYGEREGTVGWEVRDVGRKKEDLTYLLALYLEGPFDSKLKKPFPGKSIDHVQTLTWTGNSVYITLADMGVGMTDSQFNLSCACLTRTCLELTGAQRVRITSGDRSVMMTEDSLLLYDESTMMEKQNTEEEK